MKKNKKSNRQMKTSKTISQVRSWYFQLDELSDLIRNLQLEMARTLNEETE